MPTRVALTEVTPGSTGAWADVDVSALVPAGATGVILYFNNLNASAQVMGLRKNGSSDDRRSKAIRANSHNWASIGIDASRIFEAWIANATDQNIYLVGYYGTEAVFFTNATNVSTATTGSFEDVSIASLTGADTAIAAFLETESSSNEAYALRMNGSSDDRSLGGVNKSWPCIGVDGSEIFEQKIASANNDLWLVGYLKSGATMNTNATDVSIGATGAWTDLAALPAGGIAGIYECVGTSSSQKWGLRRNGDSESNVLDSHQHGWGISFADGARIVEHQIDSTNRDLFLLGYFTAEALIPAAGTVAQTLIHLGQAAAGAEKFKGTVAQTLPKLAQSAAGVMTAPYPPASGVQVIALIATPFDDSITAAVMGPPWPLGALEAVRGGQAEFSIAGGETAVYASDIGYRSRRTDTPASTWFPPRLTISFNYAVELFSGFEPDGEARVDDGGSIDLSDEKGDLDSWLDLAFDGRSIQLYRGEKGAAFSTFTRVFLGAADGLEATDRGKRIRLRDRRAAMGRLLQTNFYGGTGGLDGDAGAANQPRPLGWGPVRNAPGRVIDSTNLVIQLHDGAIHAVLDVRDKGVSLTATTDHATLALLLAASLSLGQFATCLALGLIRLGASSEGTVTVDFEGGLAPDGSYPQRTGAILMLIAMTRLGEDGFSEADLVGFDELDAAQPAIVHWYCDRAGVTVGDTLMEIAWGVGANVWATPDGMLNVQRLEAPAGPADHVIAKRNIGDAGIRLVSSIPTSRRRVGYDRMWLVQTPDQLHAELLDTDRQLYGNEYRWAIAQSPSVPYRHRRAGERDHRAFFASEADALAEVARLQALHGVERKRLTVPVVGIDPFSIKAGQTVQLEGYGRLGLDPAGSFWNVVGVTVVLSGSEKRLVLTLWG